MKAVVLFPMASMKGRISVAPNAQLRPILDKRERTAQSSLTYFFLILQFNMHTKGNRKYFFEFMYSTLIYTSVNGKSSVNH
jgi:hypothetical protein